MLGLSSLGHIDLEQGYRTDPETISLRVTVIAGQVYHCSPNPVEADPLSIHLQSIADSRDECSK
jgi:hypothetical protein